MKEFTSHSGPWVGQSIQEGFRLTEKIMILFSGNHFVGEGTDVDGDFNLEGEYDPSDQMVNIVRRYTRVTRNENQVGYPFIYIGKWNGYEVTGRWMMSTSPAQGGPFEMWPESEEEAQERAIEQHVLEQELVIGPAR
ncbi:MAG: hypothetical protein KF784_09095 [Fimbriimonadaceae bacterium]|nr:hypothetical protein [Fimbriimonadaceae bacterium]